MRSKKAKKNSVTIYLRTDFEQGQELFRTGAKLVADWRLSEGIRLRAWLMMCWMLPWA